MTDSKRGRPRHQRPVDDGRDAAHDRLRAVLRQGDPGGDGRTPSTAERAALRRLIVGAAGSSPAPAWPPLPAIAASLVAVVALAVASLLWLRPAGPIDRLPAVASNGQAAGIDGGAPPAVRNVQFVTKGGTRIVWVLNRNLDI